MTTNVEQPVKPEICAKCPQLKNCTQSQNTQKVVTRHVWEASKERANEMRVTPWGKKVYSRRKETVERSFADAKQHHGHRYARFLGLMKVQMQCLLAAAAQNMNKIALLAHLCLILWRYSGLVALFRGLTRVENVMECRAEKYRDRALRSLKKKEPQEKSGVRQQSETGCEHPVSKNVK